ncbi:MAG: hypothetical protein A2X18_06405 [Bacteroidetes bacterium GWF2_40_14]|nr:MAG: hypothetical protein A2X18_06405 [Bacteroidetes bacterium GWF2_40_14]
MKKQPNKFSVLVLFVLFAAITSSCVNLNPPDNTPIVSPVGIIPKDFDWKTVKEITCTVKVQPVVGIADNMIRVIKIFNSPLLNDGALMASGAATPLTPYGVKITLATAIPTIYVQEILPNGVRVLKTVDVSGTTINVDFTASVAANAPMVTKASPSPTIPIPTNYDVTINNNNSLTLNGFTSGNGSYGNTYKSYLIPTGFTRTATLEVGNWISHAVLYIKGVYRISNSMDLNNVSVVVLNGGRLEVDGITTGTQNANTVTVYVENGGTLVSSDEVHISNGKSIVNKGTMTLSYHLNVSTRSNFYNEGTLTVTNAKKPKTIFVTNYSFFYNSSSVYCDKIEMSDNASLLNDAGSTFETENWYQTTGTTTNNHGHIVATTEFKSSGNSYTVNNFCNINARHASLQGATYNLYEGSLFVSQTLYTNNIIINMFGGSMMQTGSITEVYSMKVRSSSDSYSVFKCTGTIPDMRYAASEFNGKIELVHALLVEGSGTNGRDRYVAMFNNNGSILSKTQTQNIVATTCNDGAGQIVTPPPAVTDNDGDGVGAALDVDDNDATVAFVSYFPSGSTWGTYAFEDLWPVKGDYDVNDMILGFKISYYTNASNLVTKLRLDYNLRAAGSTYNLAAAFQLDKVSASNVLSVTGREISGTSPFGVNANGAEGGVSLAVIPLFNSQKDVVSNQGFLNTLSGTHVITPDQYMNVKFVTPFQQSDIAMSSFNLFIAVNTRDREIHLPTFAGTSKFNPLLASGGTLYPGDQFKNADGMMWGLMIPEPFQYPSEYNSIVKAYLHFAEWATSGGTSYPDWYKELSGYIDQEFVYQP